MIRRQRKKTVVDQSGSMVVVTKSGTIYRFWPVEEGGWRKLTRNGKTYRGRIEGLGSSTILGNVVDEPDAPLRRGKCMVVRLNPRSQESVCSTPIKSIRRG